MQILSVPQLVGFKAFWPGMGENTFSFWKIKFVRLLALFVIDTNYH